MKKFFIITVAFMLIASSAIVTAQGTAVARNAAHASGLPGFTFEVTGNVSPFHSVSVNERVNIKFERQFPGNTQAVWVKNNTGFVVRFLLSGIQNSVFLDKNGNLESRIRYYTEKELPASIRNQVRSAYFDYVITSVKEVYHNKLTAYLVTVADSTTWKVIRVVDGETSVWEEHIKG